jgi:hypothetical protein
MLTKSLEVTDPIPGGGRPLALAVSEATVVAEQNNGNRSNTPNPPATPHLPTVRVLSVVTVYPLMIKPSQSAAG